jgi:hypothetical protein
MKIRISPSGPFIENSNGAPLEFGAGAMLRLVEGQTTVGGSLAISSVPQELASTLGANDLRLTLLAPNPGKAYRATVVLDVENLTSSTAATVELYLDKSLDGGTTWTGVVSNSHEVNGLSETTGGPNMARHIRCDIVLTDGGDLGVTNSPQTPSIMFRTRIGSATGAPNCRIYSPTTPADANGVGTVVFSLSEHF